MSYTLACSNCGVVFGMPADLNENLRRTHATFYCPNGHSNYYPGKTKEEKRIAELERELVDVRRANHGRFHELLDRVEHAETLALTCPVCGEAQGRRNWRDDTNRRKLQEHLADEHGARARLRAITEAASAGNA